MIVRYSTVKRVFEHKERNYVTGFGENAVFMEVSQGWFLALDDSYEAVFVGKERPKLDVGDKIRVTFEKVP